MTLKILENPNGWKLIENAKRTSGKKKEWRMKGSWEEVEAEALTRSHGPPQITVSGRYHQRVLLMLTLLYNYTTY